MHWISENLNILATLGSALAVYYALKRAASKEVAALKTQIKPEFEKIDTQLKGLDTRIANLEAGFRILLDYLLGNKTGTGK